MDEEKNVDQNPAVQEEETSVNIASNDNVVSESNKVTETPSSVSTPPETSKKKSYLWVLLIIPIILSVLALVLYFFYPRLLQMLPTGVISSTETKDGLPRYWINCSDIRQVVSEGDTLYFGCLGGVLIVDKNTGEVKGQISEANGLGNATVTSLVKKGDILYIGTQDGFTKFSLKDGTSNKISEKKGLVNAANIELYEDGNNLWVATFDGVSLYDEITGKITNFKTELDPQATKHNTNEILATDKAVYFIGLASAYSSGSVTRYDKSTKTWEVFGTSAFGVDGPYARVDLYDLAEFEGKIYVGDHGKNYWVAEDKAGTIWSQVGGLVDAISKDQLSETSVYAKLLGTDKTGLIFSAGYGFYRYVPSTNKVEVLFKDKEKLANMNLIDLDNLGLAWIKTYDKDGDVWVKQINIYDGTIKDLSLKDRPSSFYKLLALVDEQPLVLGDRSLWRYSLKKGVLEKLVSFERFDDSITTFLPISGTSKVLLFSQTCGQGCGDPHSYLFDYVTFQSEELAIPKDIADLVQADMFGGFKAFSELLPVWQNPDQGLLVFKYSENKYIQLEVLTNKWQELSSIPDGGEKISSIYDPTRCNQNYIFSENGNKFSGDKCSNIAENDIYTWEINDSTVRQTDKNTNKIIVLTPPVTEAEYSPFEDFNKPTINKLMYADNKLWVLQNRGLASYNPSDSSWKLYTLKDGMTKNRVNDLLVAQKYLWILNEWGGMSAIIK